MPDIMEQEKVMKSRFLAYTCHAQEEKVPCPRPLPHETEFWLHGQEIDVNEKDGHQNHSFC